MKIATFFFALVCLLHLNSAENVQPDAFKFPVTASDIVIVIRNVKEKSSIEKANQLRSDLVKQARKINDFVVVKVITEAWAPFGGWTILPLVERIVENYSDKKWVFFCEDTTKIDLQALIAILSTHDYNKHQFLGHALHDRRPVIIHHFKNIKNTADFKYPDFDAGWALSKSLLTHTYKKLLKKKSPGFSIDVKFEVADYIFEAGNGTRLTDVPAFCINKPIQLGICATTVIHEQPQCGEANNKKILIAVKTCEKFHKERVPVIKQTVEKFAANLVYYSDVADDTIPTESIGVTNTERGHCEKLYTMMQRFLTQKHRDIKWFVVIDDDTVMSFPRLQRMLACYNSDDDILIGERYGYVVNQNTHGYEYPTGGGGMVFTRSAVKKIIKEGPKCGKVDDPDDMWLGMAAKSLRITVVHTNSFHQSTPDQYNQEFLSHRYLVSFHKHFNVDPIKDVYDVYLKDDETRKEEL